jgi:hypothetical protein
MIFHTVADFGALHSSIVLGALILKFSPDVAKSAAAIREWNRER